MRFNLPDTVMELFDKNDPKLRATGSGAHEQFFSADMRRSIQNGDINTIRSARKKISEDLKPNLNAIKNEGANAFKEVINKSTNKPYYLCASAYGWLWVMEVETPGDETTCTIQFGLFSKNSKFLDIVTRVWKNVPSFDGKTVALGSIATLVIGGFMQRRLKGLVHGTALKQALAFTADRIATWGLMTRGQAMKLICGTLGFAAGLVASIMVSFAIDFVYRPYYLTVNIYNWDKNNKWKVVEWHGDNATVDPDGESKEWKPEELPAASNQIQLPDGGFTQATSEVATLVTYIYTNYWKVLQALGVAMKVVSVDDPSIGFYFKYVVRRFKDNRLGLQEDMQNSLDDFYKNSPWALDGTMKTFGHISKTKIPVTGLTESLRKEVADSYVLNIHIGI